MIVGNVAPIPHRIAARIDSIETRFQPRADPTSASTIGAPPILGHAAAFDPFGEAYEAAVGAVEHTPAVLAPTPTNLAFAPVAAHPGWAAVPRGSNGSYGTAVSGPTPERIAAAIAGVAAPPGVRPPGGYGPMPVPTELVGFGNGQVPTHALLPLEAQPYHRLAEPAARAWDSVVRAAAAEGITLRITDSYRDFAEQVDLVERKGLYSQGGLAATPGRSNHGWGLAVDADVTDPHTLQWLRVNGPRFGFVETSDREPWHWEFRPHQV